MSQLKQNQIDYESMKLESSRARADVEDLQAELVELNKLKQIVERNLEEALQSLQHEREQKHALKKELDQRVATDSMNSLAHLGLALGISGDAKSDALVDLDADADMDENRALKRIEADLSRMNSNGAGANEQRPLAGDLFSEIHVNELRKLEELLEAAEQQKTHLQTQLDVTRAQLETVTQEVTQQRQQLEKMSSDVTDSSAQNNASNEISELQGKIKELENTVLQEALHCSIL